jgi:hypothetical protein
MQNWERQSVRHQMVAVETVVVPVAVEVPKMPDLV